MEANGKPPFSVPLKRRPPSPPSVYVLAFFFCRCQVLAAGAIAAGVPGLGPQNHRLSPPSETQRTPQKDEGTGPARIIFPRQNCFFFFVGRILEILFVGLLVTVYVSTCPHVYLPACLSLVVRIQINSEDKPLGRQQMQLNPHTSMTDRLFPGSLHQAGRRNKKVREWIRGPGHEGRGGTCGSAR